MTLSFSRKFWHRASLRRSGTEEEYDERERLLQEIVDLQNIVHEKKSEKSRKRKDEQEAAKKIRDDALLPMKHKRLRDDTESVGSTSATHTPVIISRSVTDLREIR